MTRQEIEAALAVLPTNWVDMDRERVRALRALLRALPVLEAAREQERANAECQGSRDGYWISIGRTEAAIREHDRESS